MATFALGAGNLVEIAVESASGGSNVTNQLVYQVPSGYYAEVTGVSVESDTISSISGSNFTGVFIKKRLTGASDTIDACSFKIGRLDDGTGFDLRSLVTEGFQDLYIGALETGVDYPYSGLFTLKNGRGILMYTSDELRVTSSLSGSDNWRVRINLHIYKNP